MSSNRFSSGELAHVLSRKGIGIASYFGKRPIGNKDSGSGSIHDVERAAETRLEAPKRLQIRCAGKVNVRIKFFRYKLADYSRAISEKALLDACQYAGILRGDSEREIFLIDEGQHKVDSKDQERTELIFEFPEVDFDNFWQECERKDGR